MELFNIGDESRVLCLTFLATMITWCEKFDDTGCVCRIAITWRTFPEIGKAHLSDTLKVSDRYRLLNASFI